MPYKRQVLVEVWRVTERRDDSVFKTEYVEDRWIDLTPGASRLAGHPDNDPDLIWANKSTNYDGPTVRSQYFNDKGCIDIFSIVMVLVVVLLAVAGISAIQTQLAQVTSQLDCQTYSCPVDGSSR